MTTVQQRSRQERALKLVQRRIGEWTTDTQVETDVDKKVIAYRKLAIANEEESNLAKKGVK